MEIPSHHPYSKIPSAVRDNLKKADITTSFSDFIEQSKLPKPAGSILKTTGEIIITTAALAYGVGFGAMAFSIFAGKGPKYTISMVLPAIFSTLANYLQAKESLSTLVSVLHKKISSLFPDSTPEMLKVLGTFMTLGIMTYFLTFPGAAVISETVRVGLFAALKGFGVELSGDPLTGSVDQFYFESFMQIVRAMFLNKTLLTTPDLLHQIQTKIEEIRADEGSLSSKAKAVLGLIVVPVISSGIYGFLTAAKTSAGNEHSPTSQALYSHIHMSVKALGGLGTVANLLSAGKLTASGMYTLMEVSSQNKDALIKALLMALLACIAGVATGMNSISSFTTILLTAYLVTKLVYNFSYAVLANLPYFAAYFGALKVEELLKSVQNLDNLMTLIPEEKFNSLSEKNTVREINGFLDKVKKVIESELGDMKTKVPPQIKNLTAKAALVFSESIPKLTSLCSQKRNEGPASSPV